MPKTDGGKFSKIFDLTGRVALITGGSAGFGKVISMGLAEYGCDVAVADLCLENAKSVASEVASTGRSIGIAVDVGQPEQVKEMVATAIAELGGLDILINCAGVSQHDPAELTPLETWDRVLAINLRGTFLACQAAALQIMLPRNRGVIVNFSSIAGSVGMGRGANAYCASKGGVDTLTKQLALEWASRGIRVNAIAPCQFMTPGLKQVMDDPQFDSNRLMETWVTNIPLGRVGQPDEIFGAVLFLASDASSMVTGTVLNVDGGYLAR